MPQLSGESCRTDEWEGAKGWVAWSGLSAYLMGDISQIAVRGQDKAAPVPTPKSQEFGSLMRGPIAAHGNKVLASPYTLAAYCSWPSSPSSGHRCQANPPSSIQNVFCSLPLPHNLFATTAQDKA